MASPKSPISGHHTGRKPLQPINVLASKPKPVWNEFVSFLDSNKENLCQPMVCKSKAVVVVVESIDPSLAEELNAIRQKLERLKLEKQKTERMLKERGCVLDRKMEELQNRGELQKKLEIEVDRLFRLKELQVSCMRISPIRSLREKEGGRPMKKCEEQEQEQQTEHSSGSKLQISSGDSIEMETPKGFQLLS